MAAPKFKDHHSYRLFADEVRNDNRYVFSKQTNQFLSSFVQLARRFTLKLGKDKELYRSQRGCENEPLTDEKGNKLEAVRPLSPDRMKPLPSEAKEGRVNPKGIAYLYLSNDIDTALAESRPWLGEPVSLGYFNVMRNLKLVSFTEDNISLIPPILLLDMARIDRIVWEDINRAFSRPVLRYEEATDYIPTQILAEVLKREKYDGVFYKSRLGRGANIALFDIDSAELTKCALVEVSNIKYDFKVMQPVALTNKKKMGE